MTLEVPKTLYEQVVTYLRQAYPKEGCGVLAGHGSRAEQLYPMTNTEQSPISYLMDPTEQLQIFKRIRQAEQELVAIYHSHTASEAYPSARDIQWAHYPVSYLIVSLASTPSCARSFQIADGRVTEEALRIV